MFPFGGLIQAVIIGFIIKYLKDENAPVYEGILLLGLFGLVNFLYVILTTRGFFLIMMTIGKTKNWICLLIANKAMRITNKALNTGNNTAKVVNIIGTDIEILELLVASCIQWSIPVLFLLCAVVLWLYIGYAGIVGLGVTLLHTLLIIYLGRMNGRIKQKLLFYTDRRVEMIANLIEGIRIIKLYAWELPFLKIISKERQKEIELFVHLAWIQVTAKGLYIGVSGFSSLLAFMIYTAEGNELTAEIALPVMSIYYASNIIFTYILSMGIRSLLLAIAATKRITDVLLLEEYENKQEET